MTQMVNYVCALRGTLSVTNLSSENSFAEVSAECCSHHRMKMTSSSFIK